MRSHRRTSVADPRTESGNVAGESSSYRCLIQASAMRFPSVPLELRDRPRRSVLWWSAPACGMRAMMVEIGLEIEKLAFEIGGCPEQRTIQVLSADGADQPLHKWVGPRHVRYGLDFGHIEDSRVGLPLRKTIKRIVVGTEVFRHGAVSSKGLVKHSAKGDAVDGAAMQAKPNDATSILIHDNQNPVSAQHCRFAAKEVLCLAKTPSDRK